MPVRARLILRLAHFLLVLLLLVHVLHAVGLEIVHCLSALELLLLVLELLEIADVWLLHLLLVALDHNIWSISADENLCRHARVELAPIFLNLLGMVARLVVRKHLSLASAAVVLQVTSSDLGALDLANHGVGEAIWSDAQHPVPPVSHCHGPIAAVLLPQGRLIVFGFATAKHVAWHI